VATLSAVATAAVLTMLTGSARAGDAQVYKTVDARGNVVYTDRPSNSNTSKTSDAQGDRVSLPDKAADAKRAEARKAMDTACAPCRGIQQSPTL
jgi:hypothetical protein